MIPCNRNRVNIRAWDETTRYEAPGRLVDGRPLFVPAPRADGGVGARVANASVLLCLTPKGASTAIKRHVLQELSARGVPLAPDWRDCPHGHAAFRGLSPSPTTSLVVVRHPLHRLASAYCEIRERGFWHRLRGVVPPNASFGQLVHALERVPPRRLNAHIRPMWLTCGLLGGRRYEHVLRYEEWPALARALQRLVAPSQPLLEFRTIDALARANALYTPALATMANAWARTDSALFGYAPWVPGQAIRMAPVRHA
jgi:hypothetical protein